MDAVEHGQSFTVTRQEFVAVSRNAPDIDLDAFRGDQDAALRPRERPATWQQ
ncbi:MAG TPA: hypothetical protein VGH27_17845 [Streptosporangiaceae bacterium]